MLVLFFTNIVGERCPISMSVLYSDNSSRAGVAIRAKQFQGPIRTYYKQQVGRLKSQWNAASEDRKSLDSLEKEIKFSVPRCVLRLLFSNRFRTFSQLEDNILSVSNVYDHLHSFYSGAENSDCLARVDQRTDQFYGQVFDHLLQVCGLDSTHHSSYFAGPMTSTSRSPKDKVCNWHGMCRHTTSECKTHEQDRAKIKVNKQEARTSLSFTADHFNQHFVFCFGISRGFSNLKSSIHSQLESFLISVM